MIEPTEADIGRGVFYVHHDGTHERGVISSVSSSFVFVRFGTGSTGQATLRRNLEWEDIEREPDLSPPLTPEPSP